MRRAVWITFLAGTAVHAQRIIGTVTDAVSGHPVAGVTVRLHNNDGFTRRTVETDRSGRFTIIPPGLGLFRLQYTRFGYVAVERPDWPGVRVESARETPVRGHLHPDSVLADAMASPSSKAMGEIYFGTRRASGLGALVTRADIARTGAPDIRAAIATIPFAVATGSADKHKWTLSLVPPSAGDKGCRPALFVNGDRLNGLRGQYTDDALTLIFETAIEEVFALEVYPMVRAIPGIYAGRDLECGALILWTRKPA